MNWFKNKSSEHMNPKPFDIGKPKYNLDLSISKLMPYNSIDSDFTSKKDLLISLNDKYYSFNQVIAYSITQNIFPLKLSVSQKGYFIWHNYDNIPTINARFVFQEPSNIEGLIDWNKLFKFVTVPNISSNNSQINDAEKHLEYLLQGGFEMKTLHGYNISENDLITFEIDTEHNHLVRVREVYENSLDFDELHNKRINEKIIKNKY